mmetsp:Transcript_8666/g.14041  ORF Transcript_8666/g.14041 Transcript_8666/m.14041 type:complete len:381 (+) Transcript_8666:253-1395(+)
MQRIAPGVNGKSKRKAPVESSGKMESNLEDTVLTIEKLREEIALRDESEAALHDALREQEIEITRLRKRVMGQVGSSGLSRQLRDMKKLVDEYEGKVHNLKKKCELIQIDKESAISALESRLSIGARGMERLREEVRRLRKQSVERQQGTTTNTNIGTLSLQKECESLKAHIKRLENERSATATNKGSGNNLEAVQPGQVSPSSASGSTASQLLREKDALLKETTEALYEWKEECEILQDQVMEYESRLKSIQSKGNLGGFTKSRESELVSSLETLESAKLQREGEIERLKAEKGLEAKFHALEKEVNSYKELIRGKTQELEKLRMTLDLRERVEASLRAGYMRSEKSREKLQEEIEENDKQTSLLSDWSRSILRSFSKL